MKFQAGFMKFWSEGEARRPLAAYRIIYGFVCLVNLLLLIPDFGEFFWERGILSLKSSLTWAAYSPLNVFTWGVSAGFSDTLAVILFCLWVISAVAIILGFQFRLFSILNFILFVSFHQRNVLIIHSGDILLRVMAFHLMFSPANRIWSLDNYLREKFKQKPWGKYPFGEVWSLRLMQIQVSFLYISTFLYKSLGNTWWDGSAVYYTSRLESFFRFEVPYIFDSAFMIRLMTWSALAIEGALGFLIWVPKLRPWVLLAGIFLHLGIEITMNIPMFQWIMVSTYILFVNFKPEEPKQAQI